MGKLGWILAAEAALLLLLAYGICRYVFIHTPFASVCFFLFGVTLGMMTVTAGQLVKALPARRQ